MREQLIVPDPRERDEFGWCSESKSQIAVDLR